MKLNIANKITTIVYKASPYDPELPDEASIESLILDIINTLGFVFGGIALLSIVYASFLFITAGGNPEKISTAKKSLLFSLIGVLLMASSIAIVNYLGNQFSCLGTTGCL
jgi:hypothetical protein